MRRFAALFGVVGLASALLLAGVPAYAIDPPPPPVDAIPDIPSRTIKMAPTATWNEGKVVQMWRAVLDQATKPGTTLATVPKPVTPAGAVVRGAGPVAGTAIVGFNLGWAIGQGGLVAYSAITGESYDEMICTAPDWYQAGNDFLMMGVSPDCSASALYPNADITPGEVATIAGYGTFKRSVGYPLTFCGPTTQLPAGDTYRAVTSGGLSGMVWNTSAFWRSSVCPPSNSYGGATPSNVTVHRFEVVRAGAVIASGDLVTIVPDPERTPSCRIDWEDGTTTTGTGLSYLESFGVPMSAAGLGCEQAYVSKPGAGPDLLPEKISVDSDDGTSITTISESDVPPMTETERKGLTAPPNGRGLVLEKVVSGATQSCMTWEADCADWWADSSSGTVDDTYKCTYGGEPIPLIECGPYRETFDVRTSTPTITDPQTGQTTPWSSTDPGINTINPGTGPGTSPGDTCMQSWPSLMDPVSWVLHPIKCALVWAFVPRATVVETQLSGLSTRWSTTGIGALAGAIAGWAFVAPAAGCGGITVGIGGVFGHGVEDFQILNACPGDPLAPAAALSTVVIYIAAGLGLIWGLTSTFGGIVGQRGVGGGVT